MKSTMRALALSALMLTFFGCTQNTQSSQVTTDQVKQEFEKNYPDLKIKSVASTPLPDIYEVVVGDPPQDVVYTDPKVSYLFVGDMIDLKTKTSLKEERMRELTKLDTKQLILKNALKEVRGNGQRQLIVFSDPDCPYCKQLESELAKLDNITIYTFLYPLAELHPDAARKSRLIWCSKDPLKAWQDHMRGGKELDAKSDGTCKNPIDENIALGNKLGFNGTPMIIFPNGESIAGAMSAADIEAQLNRKK